MANTTFYTCVITVIIFLSIPVVSSTDRDMDPAPPRPHIVFVMADDMGFNDIGYHNPSIKSPFLDQLSSEGVRLENYYVQPICTPTRSQFISGRYQIHTGMQHKIIRPSQPHGLPLDSSTIADKMLEAGYSTHLVGKWHLGFHKREYLPTRRGFETFFGLYTGSSDHFTYVKCGRVCGVDLHNDNQTHFSTVKPPSVRRNPWYSTNLFTRKAIDIIEHQPKEKPLFLYLSYTAVHGPVQVPDRYKRLYDRDIGRSSRQRRQANNRGGRRRGRKGGKRNRKNKNKKFKKAFKTDVKSSAGTPILKLNGFGDGKKIDDPGPVRRNFAGMVSSLDVGVSRVVKALKDQGMWNNTILVFSTDNGGVASRGGSNFPLRGQKGTLYEGGVRAVGFVASPLLRKDGYTSTELMHVTDWFPTFVGLAGGNFRGTKDIAGFDLWPTIRDRKPSPRSMILHNIDPLTTNQARYPMFNGTFDTRIRAAIRIGDFKLLTGLPGERHVQLFNVRDSPSERYDLSRFSSFKVLRFLGVLQEYHDSAVTPYFPKSRRDGPLSTGRWEPWL